MGRAKRFGACPVSQRIAFLSFLSSPVTKVCAQANKGRMKGDDSEIDTAQNPKCLDGRLALLEKIRKTFTDSIPNNWEFYQFFNRIENSIKFTAATVIHKSRNLIGTPDSLEFGPKWGQFAE